MKLTKKHIGKFFDVEGSDGSWYYQLIDVNEHYLLFLSDEEKFEIESRRTSDWKVFGVGPVYLNRKQIKRGWKIGRRSPYNV